MNSRIFQSIAAKACIALGLIYIVAFMYYGLFWSFPHEHSAELVMVFYQEQALSFTLISLLMYTFFACVLVLTALGLYQRLYQGAEALTCVATVFALIWAALLIATGFIAQIGLRTVLDISHTDAEQALDLWRILSTLIESLGGGNELVGGLWGVLISLAALRAKLFTKALNYLGLFVGVAGIATLYPAQVLTEIFGISQIIWFIWLGLAMHKPMPTIVQGER
ncbi:hypothetical protein [Agaribacterium sp. ZY112]|uniref:hypothetical protein n=1 Tax=Agaribacterium sp. ZY112 TaxID=3233574 RepID=UPI0035264DFA